MHWTDIPGWFNWRSGQEEAVSQFPENSYFIEVGTYLGRSICSLGEVISLSGKSIHIIGVDTCRGNGPEGINKKDYHGEVVSLYGGTFAGALHKNIVDCGYEDLISLLITKSTTASQFFPNASLDWVHLDARHDYENVQADIQAWLPKIKPGGWLSGDDYDEVKWPEVVRAVKDLFPNAKEWSTKQWRVIL